MARTASFAGLPLLVGESGADGVLVTDIGEAILRAGRSFRVNYVTPDAAPIADDANFDIWVSVPAELTVVPVMWRFWSAGLAQGYVYEGPTVTDEGTALTPINLNRTSDVEATLIVKHTPTVTGPGTALYDGDWYGGTYVQETLQIVQGMVLAPSTTYLFRQTARAATLRMGFNINWTE